MNKSFNKLRIFLILILSCSTFRSEAHNYIPIPVDSSFRWIVLYQYYDQSVCEEKYLFDYRFIEDTLINGIIYKKIYSENLLLVNNTAGVQGCGVLSSMNNRYIGGFRQDTLQQKCYMVPPDSINEKIFYDFSLHVGDTFSKYFIDSNYIAITSCLDSILILTSIDSILINNQYHLRQNFNCIAPIIEGIGWVIDPFMAYTRNDYFVCLKNDTTLIYEDSPFGFYCNWFPITMRTEEENDKLINYFFDGSTFTIISKKNISKIEVYDLMGRNIFSNRPNKLNLNFQSSLFPNIVIIKSIFDDSSSISRIFLLK